MSADAAAMDRLPWLPDEPALQPSKAQRGSVLPWVVGAVALVAAGSFWLGTRTVEQPAVPQHRYQQPSTTVRLPPRRPVEVNPPHITTQPEVPPALVPEIHPSPVRSVHIAKPPVQHVGARHAVKAERSTENPEATPTRGAVAPTKAISPPVEVPLRPWNPRVVPGAAGRLVQIGAFGSVHQAKRGWWFMIHDYPAMAHLPSVVRETRNSKGRAFYRFDVGTTSQAHSEVLCQRMERIALSCAVVGLPWKAKVER